MEFTPDQVGKIKSFKWVDAEQEGTEAQPGIAIAEDVIECAETIAAYVFENLSNSHYEHNRFVISIPLETHHLLKERYNPQWTDDSRCKIFDLIKGCFSLTVDADMSTLEKHINENVMPSTANAAALDMLTRHAEENNLDPGRTGEAAGQYKVKWAKLYDEPTVLVGDMESSSSAHDQIIVEIETDTQSQSFDVARQVIERG